MGCIRTPAREHCYSGQGVARGSAALPAVEASVQKHEELLQLETSLAALDDYDDLFLAMLDALHGPLLNHLRGRSVNELLPPRPPVGKSLTDRTGDPSVPVTWSGPPPEAVHRGGAPATHLRFRW